jgi:hypothetical protein
MQGVIRIVAMPDADKPHIAGRMVGHCVPALCRGSSATV